MQYPALFVWITAITTVIGTEVWTPVNRLRRRQLDPLRVSPKLHRRAGGRNRRNGGRNRSTGGGGGSSSSGGPTTGQGSSQVDNLIPPTNTRASGTVQGRGQIQTTKGNSEPSPWYNSHRDHPRTKVINDPSSSKIEAVALGHPHPDARSQSPSKHPVQLEAVGHAVDVKVGVPPGGAGHIKIDVTGKPSYEIPVPAGYRLQAGDFGLWPGAAKVRASVSRGGIAEVRGLNTIAPGDWGAGEERPRN